MLEILQQRISSVTKGIALMALSGLAITVCSFEAHGETKTFEIDGVLWEVLLDGDHSELVKVQADEKQVIVVPSQFDGMPLTIIGGAAFNSNKSITSISLPPSLRVIGEASFSGCTGLTDVKIPEGVLTIDAYAFRECDNLKTIVVPASVESIGSGAFGYCCNLTSVTFLGDVPILGDDDFGYLSEDLFEGTPANMKIHVKKSTSGWVQWHNRSVYYDASDSDGTGDDADHDVPEWRYENDDGYAILTEDMQTGEPSISRHTKGTVTIPAEIDGMPVVEVSAYAFRGCQGVTEILVDPDSAFFVSVDGVLYDADMKTLIRCPQKKTSVTVPEGVRKIANGAFGGCEDLTSVSLPNSVEHIGKDAFYGCISLRQITIPASVSVMDSCCLGGCMNLRAVNFEGNAPDVRCLISYRMQNCKYDNYGRQLFYVEVSSPDGSRRIINETMASGEYRQVYTDEGCYTYSASYCSVFEYETVYMAWYDDNLNYDISGCPDGSGVLTNSHPFAIFDNSDNWSVGEYARTSPQVASYAKRGTCGWNSTNPLVDPEFWCGRAIVFTDSGYGQGESKDSPDTSSGNVITLLTTNIVIHYIMQSAQSTIVAPVSDDVGIVNVITEISGGNVAIPESWADNFPNFTAKYGSDFTQALTKLSGKRDASGNQMFVWQDYVAGTDPTNEKDVFRASITMSDGMPVISYTPELGEAEATKRKYTVWGKVRLQDSAWVQIEGGDEPNYNFFKVSVEMR